MAETTQFHTETADAPDDEALRRAIEACKHPLGPPSVLVYNVGQTASKNLTEATLQEFIHSFAFNFKGAFTSARAVLPGMIARHKGTIIFKSGGLELCLPLV